MIEKLLLLSIGAPLGVSLVLAARVIEGERRIAVIAQSAAAISAFASLAAVALWFLAGGAPIDTSSHLLFGYEKYHFDFTLELDPSAAVFLTLVQFVTGMVMRFSRFYLHREPGFRRFFATVLLFQAAMCLLTVAGNLDLMFAGWEMVGLSSFLLIGFYRERQAAVRNALKTYSVYRMADIGMLLAACLEGTGSPRLLGLLLLLAAIGKSAQFPFSFWIPRAMEGPTPSSALFYGGLSVHAGAYLLLRTFHLWGHVTSVRICVGVIGLVTAGLCTMFSRVQPTIKGQVGYASVTQVGLIFVELALGLRTLALVHIVTNALLRCYQLLVSPSAVAYLLRRQATVGAVQAAGPHPFHTRLLAPRWQASLYVFALSEGYLKEALKFCLWNPLRRLGTLLLPWRATLLAGSGLGVLAVILIAPMVSDRDDLIMAAVFVTVAGLHSACGAGAWRRPQHAVGWVAGSSVAVAAAVFALSPGHNIFAGVSYAAAVIVFSGLGYFGTSLVVPSGTSVERFAGYAEGRPLATACALVSALGIAGFPLLPTFLGEDLLLHGALPKSLLLSALITGVLALNGYLAVRNFSFTFLGSSSRFTVPMSAPTVPIRSTVVALPEKVPLALSHH